MWTELKLYPSLLLWRLLCAIFPWESTAYTGPLAYWLIGWLDRLGRWQAWAVYRKAERSCPAYRHFLESQGTPRVRRFADWSKIPTTTKENYVKAYSIEERCYGGALPAAGVTIDESAGSSGIPNNWVRGIAERRRSASLMQLNYKLFYRNTRKKIMMLNCYAMGPWGTGIQCSMAFADHTILKSLGPDVSKLENTLRVFGPAYHYIVMGYPPLFKRFVDSTQLDLSRYEMDLVVGGEALSEGLRDYLLPYFKRVWSSYGASDIEIAMAVESEFTIRLRRWLRDHPDACLALFGREQPPMIFQYNPAHYLIETSPKGELLFTMTGLFRLAPKIRYNLKDLGGAMSFRQFTQRLADARIPLTDLPPHPSPYPVLWLFGRGDQSVSFYGAKVFVGDIETIIDREPGLRPAIRSYQLRTYEDAQMIPRLQIRLEKSAPFKENLDPVRLKDIFFRGLVKWNQDFREVSKGFSPDQMDVQVFEAQTGPFAGQDSQIKNRYITAPVTAG